MHALILLAIAAAFVALLMSEPKRRREMRSGRRGASVGIWLECRDAGRALREWARGYDESRGEPVCEFEFWEV